jgi:predicted glycosyltransferase
VRVLRDAVNGSDLLYHSDLFIGAGGTMTREAAVLGTPTYSVFAGRPAAVDAHLIRLGRLRVLTDPHELATLSALTLPSRRERLDTSTLDSFVRELERTVAALSRQVPLPAGPG